MNRFTNKVVVTPGGSSGIGLAAPRELMTSLIKLLINLTASVIGNSTCPADRRIAARASGEGLGESDDEASSHCGDRVGDVPFGSKRRRLWVQTV
jgi:hypothetical protein